MRRKIEINESFKKALDLLEDSGVNIFITGRAGTGKSTLLKYFRGKTEKKIVVLAPTGVAAVNIEGQTVHSFFGFKPDITVEKAQRLAKKAILWENTEIYKKMEMLIIDEISMVRADLFDCVDAFLRVARGKRGSSFGGVQVVMIGDLYQLPPVVTSSERDVFNEHYKSPYFFNSNAYQDMNVELLELNKVYRQHDDEFIALLNAVRNNTIDEDGLEILNGRVMEDFDEDASGAICLTALNSEADTVNERRLKEIKGTQKIFEADVSGDFDKKFYPAADILKLKTGSQVMILNNDPAGRWINGTIGVVKEMGAESVLVELENGNLEEVEPYTWQMFKFSLDKKRKVIVSENVGKFTQLPLALAWAITIHKSQGKTFRRAIIDVGRVFTAGQVYVALSRLSSFDGLFLRKKLSKSAVRVDWRVVNFLTSYYYAESEKKMSIEDKLLLIREAIDSESCLKIVYLKSNDVKSSRVIKPIDVGEMDYRGKPFTGVLGKCSLRGEERVFRVDRILELGKI